MRLIKDDAEALRLIDRLLIYACLLPKEPYRGDMPQLLSCLRRAKNLLSQGFEK